MYIILLFIAVDYIEILPVVSNIKIVSGIILV
jgi:hypothetical protein